MKRREVYLDIESFWADNYTPKVAKTDRQDNWRQLLHDIEENGWLAHQAEVLGDFETPSQELEDHILPHLIEQKDWERFVRYAATAAQLRGMAETLEEGPVLRALAEAGRLELARALVARLPDPLRRARARAEIAVGLRAQSRDFGALTNEIGKDLEAVHEDDLVEGTARVAELARLLGLEMQGTLGPLVEKLARQRPAEADSLWRALAEGRFTSSELDAVWLWNALRSIDDPQEMPDLCPSPEYCEPWLLKIAENLEEPEKRWRLALPAVQAVVSTQGGEKIWPVVRSILGPSPTSFEWVGAAWTIWPELSEDQIRDLLDGLKPVPQVALRVARIDASSSPETLDEARVAIERLPAGKEQLHLALRLLEQGSREPEKEHRGRLAAVADHLVHIRYTAPTPDLCRYLDLVARAHDAKTLRRQVENVLWAPASSAETLRHLIGHARSQALLEELLEKTEEYAAMAAETPAEGFELRREALVTLAARLCARSKSRTYFDQAWERLLPEETDDLAEAVVEALAAFGSRDVAGEIAHEISQSPRRLRTLLEVRPPGLDLEELLSPAGLYAAVADPGPVVDEVRSLSALLETPDPPEEVQAIARKYLDEVMDPGRRIEALVDLALHAMSYQEDNVPKRLRDFPAAIAPLKQALGVVPSNDWLLGITPELVEVGARLGPAHAVAEIQEAWERMVELEDVDEERREEALLELLQRIPELLPEREETRRVRRLLDWIEDRVGDMEGETGRLLAKLQALRNREVGEIEAIESGNDSAWLRALAEDVGTAELDASDPRTIPLRRRLWNTERACALRLLADAVKKALDAGGMEGGENALRWFVSAYLAPEIGKPRESDGRRSELRDALDRSKAIGPEDEAPPSAKADQEVPGHDRLKRIERRILRSEKLQPQQSPWGRLRQGRGGAMLLVVLFASLLLFAVDGEYLAWSTGQVSPEPTRNAPPLNGSALLWMGLALGVAQAWAIRRFDWLMPTAASAARMLLFPIVPLFVLFAWLFVDKDVREQALCSHLRSRRRERWESWQRFQLRARVAWKDLSWWKRLRGGSSQTEKAAGRLATEWRYAERSPDPHRLNRRLASIMRWSAVRITSRSSCQNTSETSSFSVRKSWKL